MATIALRCGGWGDADLGGALAIYDGPADLLDRFDASPLCGGAAELATAPAAAAAAHRCASASARCATCRRSCGSSGRPAPRSPSATLLLRLVRALLPVATLYVGKLIIDEVVAPGAGRRAPGDARAAGWPAACSTASLALLALEFGAGRAVRRARARWSRCSTRCSPSSSPTTTSVRLMEHAATLDLEDFEDSELQDRLERARRQTIGPHDAA